MSDKNEQPATVEQENKPSGTRSFPIMLALLVVGIFIVAGVAGYLGYQQFQQMSARLVILEKNEQKGLSEIEKSTKTLRDNFAKLQRQIKQQTQQKNVENEKKNNELYRQLAVMQRQIQSYAGRHKSDWLLAEADYLVRIASNRLLLQHDHLTALALLMRAEERIVQMDIPELQPVREALSRDMAALRLLKREDTAGIAVRIIGLIPQVKTLPLSSFQLPEQSIEKIKQPTLPANGNWQDSLKKTFQELSVKWFEVRDHGSPVTPLMTPNSEVLLRANLTLLLQTAQFATLRQHSELYHHALRQVKNWLADYFDATAPEVIAFVVEVDSLDAMLVKVELPKKLESRLMLNQLLEEKLQRPISVKATEKSTGNLQ